MEENPEDLLTVAIFADDSLTLHGLAAILVQEPGFNVVPIAPDAQMTPATVGSADVLIWDTGRDAASTLAEVFGDSLSELIEEGLPVIAILPVGEAPGVVGQLGLAGFLPRSVRARQLRAAVHAAAAGLMVMDPALSDPQWTASTPSMLSIPEPLSPREQEALFLLAEGLTNRAIGVRLGISENTAKFHVQSVYAKLGVNSRTEAVVQATRLGLLTL